MTFTNDFSCSSGLRDLTPKIAVRDQQDLACQIQEHTHKGLCQYTESKAMQLLRKSATCEVNITFSNESDKES